MDRLPGGERRGLRILACLDSSPLSRKTVAPAVALARALGGDLTLVRVLEARSGPAAPNDPVAWDLRRRQARDLMEEIAHEEPCEAVGARVCVLEGRAGDEICALAQDRRADLTVVCTHGEGGASDVDIGRTAQQIMQSAPSSVLLAPSHLDLPPDLHFKRIIVPLDGSSRAESALPHALRIARAENATLILVHAVPAPELTGFAPPEPEDLELRERLAQRNERVAREYLDRVRAHLAAEGVDVRALVLREGDARHALVRAIETERADLVVMSSHGQSGLREVGVGGVCAYLLARSSALTLVVRSQAPTPPQAAATQRPTGARLPARAVQ